MEETMDSDLDKIKFGSFLDEIKQRLDRCMNPSEFQEMAWLMRDKLEQEFIPLENCELPSNAVTYLEKNMQRREVISVLKHVLGFMKFHSDNGALDFYKYIEHYEITIVSSEEENLIGREEDVSKIFEMFEKKTCQAVWIHGLGGLGKTTLARTICLRAKFSLDWDFIAVDLKETRRVTDMFRAILGHFSSHLDDTDEECLRATVLNNVGMIKRDTVLLLDNIEDIQDADNCSVDTFLSSLLRICPCCVRILITSRNRYDLHADPSTAVIKRLIVEYDLRELSNEDACILLRVCCKPKRLSDDMCQQALSKCSRIPLTLKLLSNAIRSVPEDQLTVEQISKLHFGEDEIDDRIAYAYEKLPLSLKEFAIELTVFETSTFDIDDVAEVLNKPRQEMAMMLMYLCHCHVLNEEGIFPRASCDSDTVSFTDLRYSFHNLIFHWLEKRQNKLALPITQYRTRFCFRILKSMRTAFGEYHRNTENSIMYVSNNTARLRILFRISQSAHFYESIGLDDFSNLTTASNLMMNHAERMEHLQASEEHLVYSTPECIVRWKIDKAAYFIDARSLTKAETVLRSISETAMLVSMEVTQPMTKADYFIQWARLMRFKRNIANAKEALGRSLMLLQNYRPVNDLLLSKTAYALNTFGNVYHDSHDYDKSLEYHTKAVDTMKQIDRENNVRWPTEMSIYLFNIGTVALAKAKQILNLNRNDKKKAGEYFDICLARFDESLCNDRALKNLDGKPKFAERLQNRAKARLAVGNFNGAEQDANEALAVLTKFYEGVHKKRTVAKYLCGKVYLDWSEHLKEKESNPERATEYFKKSRDMFNSAVEDVYQGGLSSQDREAMNFLKDYQRMANATVNKKYQIRVEEFCMEFKRKGTYDPEEMSEEESSSSPEDDPDSPQGRAVLPDICDEVVEKLYSRVGVMDEATSNDSNKRKLEGDSD